MLRNAMKIGTVALALIGANAQAQTASGKFTCNNETNTIESAVAAWVPAKKSFYVWGYTQKFTDDELKALAIIEGGSALGGSPKAMADKAFQKAAWDAQAKARASNKVMIRGYLKETAQKVEWSNADGAVLMYVKCLKNENLNFSKRPGEKKPEDDIVKQFKSFDFPLKDGAKVKYQTIAFKHAANPKGISTTVGWDYKVDAKVYVVE